MINKEKNGIVKGRTVLFVLPNGVQRPAVIVEDWAKAAYSNGEVNVLVFTDFVNDQLNMTEWKTSVPYSSEPRPGTWSWPDGHHCDIEPVAATPSENQAAPATGTGATSDDEAAKEKREALAKRDLEIGTPCALPGDPEGQKNGTLQINAEDPEGPLVCVAK